MTHWFTQIVFAVHIFFKMHGNFEIIFGNNLRVIFYISSIGIIIVKTLKSISLCLGGIGLIIITIECVFKFVVIYSCFQTVFGIQI